MGSSPIISTFFESMINTKKYRKALILLCFAVLFNFYNYIINAIIILIFQPKDDTKDDTKSLLGILCHTGKMVVYLIIKCYRLVT